MPPRSLKRRLPPPPRPRQRNLTEKSSIARITQGGGKKGQKHGCRTRMHNISLAGFTRKSEEEEKIDDNRKSARKKRILKSVVDMNNAEKLRVGTKQ